MRGDLTKAGDFSNIKTDIDHQTCSFEYARGEGELKTRLDELAKTNSHLNGWSLKK